MILACFVGALLLGTASIPLMHQELTGWADALLAGALCLCGAGMLLLVIYY